MEELKAIRSLLTANDKKEIAETLKISKRTLEDYLQGRRNKNTELKKVLLKRAKKNLIAITEVIENIQI